MLHSVIRGLDWVFKFDRAKAHCDIPCKIYDPISAQLAALSVIRFHALIADLSAKSTLSIDEQATLSRLITEKEVHAEKVKHEVRVIWGDYFKEPQFNRFPETHDLVHQIMLSGSACKQHLDPKNGDNLLDLVNQFSSIFWATKDIETYTAISPYPPSKSVVYPKLG